MFEAKKKLSAGTAEEIAKEAIWKADKWLPEDQEDQEDYFNSSDKEKTAYINDHIDQYFNKYFDLDKDGSHISKIRKDIVKIIVRDL